MVVIWFDFACNAANSLTCSSNPQDKFDNFNMECCMLVGNI